VIFRAIGDGRPYPEHGFSTAGQWAGIPPRQVRLADLTTTKRTLDLGNLVSEDSTFYGDLFAHVVYWQGVYYLEDGLHRAVRAALRGRQSLHARVLNLDQLMAMRAARQAPAPATPPPPPPPAPGATQGAQGTGTL
jgi:Arc/MetJ family transcription regulator